VLKTCRKDEGRPVARSFHPRWTGLVRALARANARTFYHNCAEYVTGQVAWFLGGGTVADSSTPSRATCTATLRCPTPTTGASGALPLRSPSGRPPDRADRDPGADVRRELRRSRECHPDALFGAFGGTSSFHLMGCGRPRGLGRPHFGPIKRPDRLLEVAETCPTSAFDIVGPVGTMPTRRRSPRRPEVGPTWRSTVERARGNRYLLPTRVGALVHLRSRGFSEHLHRGPESRRPGRVHPRPRRDDRQAGLGAVAPGRLPPGPGPPGDTGLVGGVDTRASAAALQALPAQPYRGSRDGALRGRARRAERARY
jgi:hypothetical protein